MDKGIAASEYILLGECVLVVMNPQASTPDKYNGEVTKLYKALQNCGFTTAYAAASSIGGRQIYPDQFGRIHAVSVEQLKAAMKAVYQVLYQDAENRQTIVLKNSNVSGKLRDLGLRLPLNESQKHLQEETIRCIECEAYRAGAVMAWGLAYDWIRRWLWDDAARRASFNAELQKKTGSKGALLYSTGLTTYEDFYSIKPPLNERSVLDAMSAAGQLTGVYDKLCHYLGERNRYAHANNLVPSLHQTNHYIEDLMDLITNAPFV